MADAEALFDHGFEDYPIFAAIAAGGTYGVHRIGDSSGDVSAGEDLQAVGYEEDEVQVAASIEDDELVLVASAGDEILGTVAVDAEPPAELPGLADALGWLFGSSTR